MCSSRTWSSKRVAGRSRLLLRRVFVQSDSSKQKRSSSVALCALRRWKLIQEVGAVERIALDRAEARIADDAAQFFFGGAVGDAGGAHDVLFEHHRAHVIAAEAQPHLAD